VYIPKWFRETNQAALHDLMRANSFATLISQHDGAPYASHVPILLQADAGPHGTLVGHMARANAQWRDFAPEQEVLTIFQGPHAYVSPSWYETELSVPTWNYAVVHAYGTPRVIEDHAALYDILKATVAMYEAPFEQPWPFDLPEDFVDKMMRAIVGFAIPITRLEGKYKLSQNRPLADQQRVVEALYQQGDALSTGTAALMRPRMAASPAPPS
jgi:transcriptional regulator